MKAIVQERYGSADVLEFREIERPAAEAGEVLVRAAVAEATLQPKPSMLTFEQAAAVPTSGSLAVQHVRDEGRLQPGQTVLINGAGGAVGSFAVQLAKAWGAT